jgi:hypothetical protein
MVTPVALTLQKVPPANLSGECISEDAFREAGQLPTRRFPRTNLDRLGVNQLREAAKLDTLSFRVGDPAEPTMHSCKADLAGLIINLQNPWWALHPRPFCR